MNPHNNDNSELPNKFSLQTTVDGGLNKSTYLSLTSFYLPPALTRDDSIEILGFPTRLENTLRYAGGITTVGELCDTKDKLLLGLRNMGPKSVNYLIEVKRKINEKFGILQNSKSSEAVVEDVHEKSDVPVNQLVSLLLDRCGGERAREVITKRYGLMNGERQTLEEIGEFYGVTRERIRQIQVKSLNRMKHPITLARKPLIEIIDEILFRNGGIISAEEADMEIPKALGGIRDDGSSLLDLLSDLGWIQNCRIGDISIYTPTFEGVSLCKLSEKIISLIKTADIGMDSASIARNITFFNKIKDERFNAESFITRYCRIDPRIEEVSLAGNSEIVFRHYTSGHFGAKVWAALMIRVLEEEQMPLHFTEITNKVNDLLGNSDRQLDVRRAHSILIENDAFAHSGIHGTYGLTSWGFRKESTFQLVDECLKKAGFPLHWKQIYNYVSKYKDSKQGSIMSILETKDHYQRIDSGTYWFRERRNT